MNNVDQHSDDRRMHALLSGARPQPELPPCFRENVWQRIEQAEAPAPPSRWIEALAGWLLEPRFAIALVAVLLLAGTVIGSLNGHAQARLMAHDRYVNTVVMPVAQ
jgi:hypothetical protein